MGHVLGETLRWPSTDGQCVAVRYAGSPRSLAKAEPIRRRRRRVDRPVPVPSGEPEATARVIVEQLGHAGIQAGDPQPWPLILPERIPPSNPDRAVIVEAANELLEVADEDPQRLVLVVGNSPQVEWIAEELLERPVAIGRGEIVCIGKPRRRRPWAPRRRRDLLWTIGPDETSAIDDLLGKIHSKMDTAKFLGTFITALVTFVLGKRFDATRATAGAAVELPRIQGGLWAVTIAALGIAALLCYAAVFYYDTLLMPRRFWAPSARPGWFQRHSRFARAARQRGSEPTTRPWWLVQRPPSSAAWVLQQNMMRIWSRLVLVAMWTLGIALAAFAVLVLATPTALGNLGPTVLLIAAVGALAIGYVVTLRPRLGVED
ncbi:MAG TPA: hypothetical protein VF486_20085 [Actinomycetes bacterium]